MSHIQSVASIEIEISYKTLASFATLLFITFMAFGLAACT